VAALPVLGTAHVAGRLYDLGAFPGMVLEPRSRHAVAGWLLRLPVDPTGVLGALDHFEGRRFVRVTTTVFHGRRRMACWVYTLRRPPTSGRPIRSGRWSLAPRPAKR
jgi:gamma-glutamylcyclotransferase (GGCT)/AIG2-like uncharacterized protein YtfP